MASWLTESKYLFSPIEDIMNSPVSPGSFSTTMSSDDSKSLLEITSLELTITPTEYLFSPIGDSMDSPATTSEDGKSLADPSGTVSELAITPTKKRKTTYYNRKEEKEELTKLIQELEGQIRNLETRTVQRQLPLQASLATNSLLQSCVEQSRQTIAATQSMIGSCATLRQQLPMASHIHLPQDATQRQQLILAMKPQKTQDAVTYLLQRCQFLDLGSPYRQLEHYVTGSGDHISLHWEVVVFEEDSPSAANVFSDLLYFVHNEELEMAAKLGTVSVRESDSIIDDSDADQVRMVSTHQDGLLAEKNVVVHSQFFQQSDFHPQPHGVLTVDFVDEDDVFPYQTECRVRKDLVSAALVLEVPPVCTGDPSRVALIHWAYAKVHSSPLASAAALAQLSRECIVSDFDAMVGVVRERSAWRTLAGVFN